MIKTVMLTVEIFQDWTSKITIPWAMRRKREILDSVTCHDGDNVVKNVVNLYLKQLSTN